MIPLSPRIEAEMADIRNRATYHDCLASIRAAEQIDCWCRAEAAGLASASGAADVTRPAHQRTPGRAVAACLAD